ncbi:cellulose binding domain-containing protein [Herbivorax alkaliphila]
MYNIITSPPQYESGLSFKYFVDLSEYASEEIDISKFTTDIYSSPAKAQISELKPWEEDENIYYVEVTFPDDELYARTYVQFAVNFYENNLWDSSNDFSAKEITDAYSKTENIPIYKNGVQVFGKILQEMSHL